MYINNFNTASPPSPNDVNLIEESPSSNYITFNWSEVTSSCPGLFYRTNIISQNCHSIIICPIIKTPDTTVTCTMSYVTDPNNFSSCEFAVQTVVCDGIAGDFSTLDFTGMYIIYHPNIKL